MQSICNGCIIIYVIMLYIFFKYVFLIFFGYNLKFFFCYASGTSKNIGTVHVYFNKDLFYSKIVFRVPTAHNIFMFSNRMVTHIRDIHIKLYGENLNSLGVQVSLVVSIFENLWMSYDENETHFLIYSPVHFTLHKTLLCVCVKL